MVVVNKHKDKMVGNTPFNELASTLKFINFIVEECVYCENQLFVLLPFKGL